MQEMKYRELENRASDSGDLDLVRKMEARSRVRDVRTRMKAVCAGLKMINQMKEEGQALILTPEEENMLRSFRRFKLRMRKQGEIFTWQTRIPDGVELVEETGLVMHPSEVAK